MHELKQSKNKVVGLKQTVKVIKNNTASKVYIAQDADEYIKSTVMDAVKNTDIQIIYINTMKELGEACGIDIGASTAAIVNSI